MEHDRVNESLAYVGFSKNARWWMTKVLESFHTRGQAGIPDKGRYE